MEMPGLIFGDQKGINYSFLLLRARVFSKKVKKV